jgi:hypothetical protein
MLDRHVLADPTGEKVLHEEVTPGRTSRPCFTSSRQNGSLKRFQNSS